MKLGNSIFKTFFLSLSMIANVSFAYAQTASILPPAKTTFVDQNGKPLTGGTVDFYIPNTTTRKTTWKDSAETIPNTNPVVLDSAGRALILGSGSYRQVVKDRYDNIIWDAVTSSTGSGATPSIATGDGDLVGTIKPWGGMTAPNQYAFTYGQEVSRTTYAALYTAITSSQAVFCTSGSAVLTGLSDTTNFPIGAPVEVSCVADGFSTIVSKTSNSVTLAANANISTNTTAVIFPWGNGNHVNTFNLPDFRGVPIVGNNNMGGVASLNLTTTYFGTNPNSIGALSTINIGGSHTLVVAEVPSLAFSGTTGTNSVGHTHTYNQPLLKTGLLSSNTGGSSWLGLDISANTSGESAPHTHAYGGATSGGGGPHSIVMPSRTSNYIIKIMPDTNSATASGVTSLGSMTGDISCGIGVLCTGNTISSASLNSLAVTQIYVSPSGSDSSNGFSWASPKLTLQAGIDAATGGGNVNIASGTYTLAATVNVRANVSLICSSGVTITQNNGANLTSLIDFSANVANNASIRGCTIDGNRDNNTVNSGSKGNIFIGVANNITVDSNTIINSPGNAGVEISTGTYPIITNNTFTNNFYSGLYVVPRPASLTDTFGNFSNNTFNQSGAHAITLDGSDFNIVSNNNINGTLTTGLTATLSGTTVTITAGGTPFSNTCSSSTICPGNFIIAGGGGVFQEAFITSISSSTVATASVGLTGVVGAAVIGGTGDLINVAAASNNTISGNTLRNGAGGGIVVSNGGDGGTFGNVTNNNYYDNFIGNIGGYCLSVQQTGGVGAISYQNFVGNTLLQCLIGGVSIYQIAINPSGATTVNGTLVSNISFDSQNTSDIQGSPTTPYWLAIQAAPAGSVTVGSHTDYGMVNAGVSGAPANAVAYTSTAGQTFTASQLFNDGTFLLKGSASGYGILHAPAAAGTASWTFPAANGTVALTGGANIPTVATGDLLYGSATNTLSALADVATGNAIISGGVGVAPSWGKIGLATHVTGTLAASQAPAYTGDCTSSAGSLTLACTANTAWAAFTPTFTCGTATITDNGSRSKTNGKTTFIEIDFTITAIGSCTSTLTFTLPNTANAAAAAAIGQDIAVLGAAVICRTAAASTTSTCLVSGFANFLLNSHVVASGLYENQ